MWRDMSNWREREAHRDGEWKAYPDALVQLDLLLVIVLRVEGVKADVVVNQLLPDLVRIRRLVSA